MAERVYSKDDLVVVWKPELCIHSEKCVGALPKVFDERLCPLKGKKAEDIDMVFIRGDGRVHRIEVRTEPMSERIIESQGDVTAVLELAGGAAERIGLKAGDLVRHPVFKTK